MTRALIADDEAPLRSYLRRQLHGAWPELEIIAEAADGAQALQAIDTLSPEVCFLDIQMPVLSGLEVARRMRQVCHVVFVTAFDQYALAAFDAAAVDYLLKPVSDERLRASVERIKRALSGPAPDLSVVLEKLTEAWRPPPSHLQWIQVAQRDDIVLLSVDEIDCFLATDKYTLALRANQESVLRTPLKELEATLDPAKFWRVHRNAIVRVGAIERVRSDLRGNLSLELKGSGRKVAVGRSQAHRFRQM